MILNTYYLDYKDNMIETKIACPKMTKELFLHHFTQGDMYIYKNIIDGQ